MDEGEPVVVRTGHGGPCHAAVTGDGRRALVAHYGTGVVVAVGLDGRGSPVEVTGEVDLTGHWSAPGPVPERQDASHPHQVVVDGDVALVPDLGCDVVHQVRVRADGSLQDLHTPVRVPPGFGPRHLVLVDDLAVLVGELSSQVAVVRRTPGSPGVWEDVTCASSTLTPVGSRGSSDPSVGNLAAAIHYADGHVLVSNRGHDTVCVFSLDRAAGTLAPVRELSTGGAWPRDVLPDGDVLWVTNERSDTVTAVRWRGADAGTVLARVSAVSPTSVALG